MKHCFITSENGSMTVETVLWTPIFVGFMFFGLNFADVFLSKAKALSANQALADAISRLQYFDATALNVEQLLATLLKKSPEQFSFRIANIGYDEDNDIHEVTCLQRTLGIMPLDPNNTENFPIERIPTIYNEDELLLVETNVKHNLLASHLFSVFKNDLVEFQHITLLRPRYYPKVSAISTNCPS